MDASVVIVVVGLIAATIAVSSYVTVLLRGESDPHWVTWLVWTVIGGIGTWSAYDGGAGTIGVLVPLFFVLVTFTIFAVSSTRSHAIVTRVDLALGALSVATLIAWRYESFSPGYAAAAAVSADVGVLYPTLRNARRTPTSEPLRPWLCAAFAAACGLLVLDSYTFASVLYPAYGLAADLGVAGVIVVARRLPAWTPRADS